MNIQGLLSKRFFRVSLCVLLVPLVLLLLLVGLLYLPPVQDFAVRRVSAYVSEQTGFDIGVGRLRLSPLLDLRLEDFSAVDEEGDTLVTAQKLIVDLDMGAILRGRVGVEEVSLHKAQTDTKALIPQMRLRGYLSSIKLKDDVDLRAQRVNISSIKGQTLVVDIALRDTTLEEDTTVSAPLDWFIRIGAVNLSDIRLSLTMPGDSSFKFQVMDFNLAAADIDLDLKEEVYRLGHANLTADSLLVMQGDPFRVDNCMDDTIRGFCAPSVIERKHFQRLSSVNGPNISSVNGPLDLSYSIVSKLSSFHFQLDSVCFDGGRGHVSLPAMSLTTPTSRVAAAADLDLRALEPGQDGGLTASVETDFSRADIVSLAGAYLPEAFGTAFPDMPLRVRLSVAGNIDSLALTRAEASVLGSIYFDARGWWTTKPASPFGRPQQGGGLFGFNLETKDLDWVKPLAEGALDGFRLPAMSVGGTATIDGTTYGVDAVLHEGAGLVALKGTVDTQDALSYDATVKVSRLNVRHFMPRDSIGVVSLTAKARGTGTNLFDRATRLHAEAAVSQLTYGHYDLSGLQATAQVTGGRGKAHLQSDNALLAATADVDALLARRTSLTFGLDLQRADLLALGVVTTPLKTAMCLHVDGSTDLSNHHQLSGSISDIVLQLPDTIFRMDDMELSAILRPDTTHAYLQSGDLLLTANGRTGYDQLLGQLQHFTDELNRQMTDRRLDHDALRHRLPQIDLHLRAGQQNPLYNSLKMMGYDYETARLDLNLDPQVGINGGGHIYKMNTGTVLLDTIGMHIYQDSTGVKMDARVRNSRRNPQITFEARMNAYVLPTGAGANLIFYDERGRKGVDLGAVATIEEEGFRVHVNPLSPVIAYRTFRLNANNYVMLGREGRIEADMSLKADDGTGLKLYSTPNADALQDLSVSVNSLNLGELMNVLPYAPHLTGFLDGDAHLIQTPEHLSVSADMTVQDMTYEGAPLGQMGVQAVYLPNADGSHFIDGSLLQTGMPVATFSGTYTPKGEQGLLDIDAQLERLPFSMVNGFIPDGMARLEGVAIGELHVGGSTEKPVVDGMMATSGLRLLSDPYSLKLRFQDDTIRVAASDLQLNRLEVYSVGSNPFVLDGSINFADLSRITVDATMAATNFELINAKKTSKAQAYGKVFVDFSAMLRGTLDNLRVFGRLNVLPETDVTYVLGDSPLAAEDQLADLVEFVDFEDTLRVLAPESVSPQNINMVMNVNIANAAQVHCLITPDGSSYVDLEGGGELSMTYSPEKDLQLNGRYTINRGTLKYTMMVIPLKEFTIKSGSFVEFRGPIMNPTLNLSATERMRTTITENDHPRSVSFDVGMNITQTLENLGLEFTLAAPEDMTIQNELAAMSPEQRGRLAVTMLATGMYINDAGSITQGGVTGQNALNAFLQSQISNITGKALKSVDISLGMEQGTTATGQTTTDYSFRFAKRFWGNRVSVIVGGRVSTGEDVSSSGQSIIDNVSIEYRLDKSASRYINLFYDKSYESLLDGEIIEMGGGLVLRKKSNTLGELFIFKK